MGAIWGHLGPFWRDYRAPFRDLDSLGPELCSGALLFPNDQLQNSDPRRNHLFQHLKRCAQGSERFHPASQDTEDRMEAYSKHYYFVQEEYKVKEYSNPYTEKLLKETYLPE